MGGLIPLKMLDTAASAPGRRGSLCFSASPSMPGNRNSICFPGPSATPGNRNSICFSGPSARPRSFHNRNSSFTCGVPPTPAKPSPTKRNSQLIPFSLSVLPYTTADWKRAVADVKRQHVIKKYRACFTRCNEILENVKDRSGIQPAFLITLHFYAATSMEMCARPLSATSLHRAELLQQARSHYDLAAELIKKAEETYRRPNSILVNSTTTTPTSVVDWAMHSPAGSVSSRATSMSLSSSPTNSICSLDALTSAASSVRAPSPKRKKVSFSLPPQAPVLIPEPYIRPDSPTLGFDDEYFTAAYARPALPPAPAVPKRPRSPPPPAPSAATEVPAVPELDPRHSMLFALPGHRLSSAVNRYCELLQGLKAQVAAHSTNLNEMLAATPEHHTNLDVPSSAAITKCISLASSSAPPTLLSEEMRKLDRTARIQRLRQNGWQRKRFDARRYEQYANEVLADLH